LPIGTSVTAARYRALLTSPSRGTVAAVAWTAYDVYELSHMIYEAYVEVDGEQGALEEWNKAVN
jgi:hypothetical protein